MGAAVGIQDDDIERLDALIKNAVDIIVVDVANGHN